MRGGTKVLWALALALLCVAAHFQVASCRGGAGGGGRGGGGRGGGGGSGRGRSGRPAIGAAGAVIGARTAAGGSHGHRSAAGGASGCGAWRVAGAGAALAGAALVW
ncbi:hypothetical protein BS78_09G191800 [Paspalum vaginatum]|nr:hypothetical protein BS78_09G191800 [Paspalum vaginatum]